jgi:hypothetical protein
MLIAVVQNFIGGRRMQAQLNDNVNASAVRILLPEYESPNRKATHLMLRRLEYGWLSAKSREKR